MRHQASSIKEQRGGRKGRLRGLGLALDVGQMQNADCGI